jgi:hypothetical protein
MSPENQDVFQLLKEVAFSKNYGILMASVRSSIRSVLAGGIGLRHCGNIDN